MKMAPTAELHLHAELMAIFKKWSTGANRKERMVEGAKAERWPVYQNLLPDLEHFQRPEPLLAVYPGSPGRDSRQPQPCPSPSASHLVLMSTGRRVVTMFFSPLPASGEGRTPPSPPLLTRTRHTSRGGPETNFYCKMGTFKSPRGQIRLPPSWFRGAEPYVSSGPWGEGLGNGSAEMFKFLGFEQCWGLNPGLLQC